MMRRWQGRGAGRDTTSTLGVAEKMLDPTWNVVGARASVEFLGGGYLKRVFVDEIDET